MHHLCSTKWPVIALALCFFTTGSLLAQSPIFSDKKGRFGCVQIDSTAFGLAILKGKRAGIIRPMRRPLLRRFRIAVRNYRRSLGLPHRSISQQQRKRLRRMRARFRITRRCFHYQNDYDGGAPQWTTFNSSADTQVIFVSSSDGNDNTCQPYNAQAIGLTTSDDMPAPSILPCKTIAKGYSLLRHEQPDWMLLKRGDVFQESLSHGNGGRWQKSGRSSTERMIVGSYGTSKTRPKIDYDGYLVHVFGGGSTPEEINYLAFLDFHQYASYNDQTSAPYHTPSSAGVRWLRKSRDVLFENVHLEFASFVVQASSQEVIQDFSIRYSIVERNYGVAGECENSTHSQGIFTSGIKNLLLEGNLFDHNGWHPDIPCGRATMFNRNMYLSGGDGSTTLRFNIDARGSSGGVQVRMGGLVEDNLYLQNPVSITLGSSENSPGTIATGTIRRNVILDAQDIDSTAIGWGIVIGGSGPAAGGGTVYTENVHVHDNIISRNVTSSGNSEGIHFRHQHQQGHLIENNIVYHWGSGIDFFTQVESANGVMIRNNQIQLANGARAVSMIHPLLNGINFNGNTYYSSLPEHQWFRHEFSLIGFNQWLALSQESGASNTQIQYLDPDRNISSYHASIGGEASLEAFLSEAKKQSRFNWRSEYAAPAVNNYIRAGFGIIP